MLRMMIAASILLLSACDAITAEGRLQKEAEDSVRRQLRDPESARFDYGLYPMIFPDRGLVCGEVNARNGFGGYTGNQMFAYARDQGARLAESDMDAFIHLHRRCLAGVEARTKEITDRTNAMYENDPELRNKVGRETGNVAAN